VLGEEERGGFRAAAGGERHEDGAELGLKIPFHLFTTVDESTKDGVRPPGQHFLVRNQYKVLEPLGLGGGIEQVGFGRERQSLQILEGAE